MKQTYLQVTYRQGRPLAAYYYLPRRDGDRSARTERADDCLLVDVTADGRAIGIEIPSPSRFSIAALNAVLARYGFPPARPEELSPLVAA